VRNHKADRALNKLQRRKVYRRATPLMREMAKIDVLKNHRLYSEALVASLSVLNTWPETVMPYAGIVDVLTRLKLKDTDLYTFAAEKRGGRGGRAGKGSAGLGAVSNARRLAQAGLPPSGVAPRLHPEQVAGAAPGGAMSVQPTPDAQKQQPGPVQATPPEASESTPAPDPRRRDAQEDALRRAGVVQGLKEALAAQEARVQEAQEAEKRVRAANENATRMEAQVRKEQQATEQAEQTLTQKESNGAPPAEIQAARDAVKEAHRRLALAEGEFKKLEEKSSQTANTARAVLEQTGSAAEAEEAAKEIQRQMEAAEQASSDSQLPGTQGGANLPATGPDGVPGSDPRSRLVPDPSGTAPAPGPDELAHQLEIAHQDVSNAETQARRAQDGLQSANQAVRTTRSALDQAEEALRTAEAGGDAAAIEAARQDVGLADGDLQRSEMEVQRAHADVDRTIRNLQNAQANLLRTENPAADK